LAGIAVILSESTPGWSVWHFHLLGFLSSNRRVDCILKCRNIYESHLILL